MLRKDYSNQLLRDIAARFVIELPIEVIRPLGNGLINETFYLEAGDKSYVLQRLNSNVFPNPEQIIANLKILTQQFAKKTEFQLKIPALIANRDGKHFFRTDQGEIWRLLEFIPETINLPRLVNIQQAREVGRMLGCFHQFTAQLSHELFKITLPNFHETGLYLDKFLNLWDKLDQSAKSIDIQTCVNVVFNHQSLAREFTQAQQAGILPLRVTHGDPKLDNILFNQAGTCACALVDLDTIQPGLLLHDLGDCLRSCCNFNGEDILDSSLVRFDLKLSEGILRGYAQATQGLLTYLEIEKIYEAICLLPFELGLRFLIDHLEGNCYFHVTTPGQNLHKALIQFALLADIERQEQPLRALIADCFALHY